MAMKTSSAARKASAGRKSTSPVSKSDLRHLVDLDHGTPHAILGAHPVEVNGAKGVAIRAMMPDAVRCDCVLADGSTVEMEVLAAGSAVCFGCFIEGATLPIQYRLRFHFADGSIWERGDPYRFLPAIGEMDLHLFNEGTHRQLWTKLGAIPRVIDGVAGVSFAVWAPNARRVSVVGDFNRWDGRVYPMRRMGSSGVWELFIPEVRDGSLYKFEILTDNKQIRTKTDPFARKIEQHPGTASIVVDPDLYVWSDDAWMDKRTSLDLHRAPMAIYEVHLGSWARVPEEDNRSLTYREMAPRLAAHVKQLGFTHIELLPVMEHPFYGSWGYQVSGYYAPTSRYGSPDDFRYLVDVLHQNGIGVILDWVPAHFPKDDFALRRFDGTALFEHEDPRLGEHPDWGTLIFNYGRNEVRNFLVANALYWLQEFHIDGLRVDAVASMLYLDYSRKAGEWLRNVYGGRENLEAIQFLREFNEAIQSDAPGCFTVAEESTSWPGVTKPANEGGLGFTFKWNMGWMHDTLQYFSKDPIHRRFHHDQLTFAMVYEHSERFIMPLSHDEVVHLKGSLLTKMAGDEWQKHANLRVLLAYMFTRPGKKLLFMGAEIAPYEEWAHESSLPWNLLHDDPARAAHARYLAQLVQLYRDRPSLWIQDESWEGFAWIDIADRDNSVISYVRRGAGEKTLVILNLTPVPREGYRIGVPDDCSYRVALRTDDAQWGGSGYDQTVTFPPEPSPFHGFPQSIVLTLPPLCALVLSPNE
jgi:1,4-alpha-glucan branching enzyme